jgi:hypothetical protein
MLILFMFFNAGFSPEVPPPPRRNQRPDASFVTRPGGETPMVYVISAFLFGTACAAAVLFAADRALKNGNPNPTLDGAER